MEEVWSASSGLDDDTKDRAFVESHSAPRPPIATLDSSITESNTSKPRTARRRLPKASSSTACCNERGDSSKKEGNVSPVTPEKRQIRRSHTTVGGKRKPATPYSVTPQVGSRRSAQAVAFVESRTPLVL